jgi:hypothetical protein
MATAMRRKISENVERKKNNLGRKREKWNKKREKLAW